MAGVTTSYQTGIHSARPAASAGCILYSCTTHGLVYRSDGSTWTTWLTLPAGSVSATPALTLGTTAAAGSASTFVATDATLPIFDATSPSTQTFGDSAAVGTAAFAAHGDHKHAMPADPRTLYGCSVYNSAVVACANNADTLLNYDSENYDTNALHFTSAANLTGTVTKASGSPNIVGSSTLFTSELTVNQVISIPGTAAEIGVVKTITDNTHLVLWQNMANAASGQTATRQNQYIAIPSGGDGYWRLMSRAIIANTNSTGGRYMTIRKNGTQLIGGQDLVSGQNNSSYFFLKSDLTVALVAGDYVAIDIFQNSGGSINVGGSGSGSDALLFEARRVGV